MKKTLLFKTKRTGTNNNPIQLFLNGEILGGFENNEEVIKYIEENFGRNGWILN